MGLLSRFRPTPAPAAAELSPPGRAWRRNDLVTAVVGDDAHLVSRRGRVPMVLPAFAVDFLLGCRRFRPLEEHVAEHAGRHRWGALESEALRSWLPRMIEAELLVSSQQVFERCAAMRDGEAAPPLEAIGFPTGGARTALVERALRSFRENLRAHGRRADVLISDGSTDAAHRAAFRALARSSRARYAGEEEKRRYAAELVRRSGCDPAAVEFALFDPLATGFACGANRNAIVLHGAGRMVCSVDDDVVCRIVVPPSAKARLALFSTCDPFDRELFADRARALADTNFGAFDFLAGHEAMLGRGPGAWCGDGVGEGDLDLENMGDELLRRLQAGPARVRATFAGHIGDPGIPSATYYLFYSGENRERLPHDEAEYRARLASRSVLARAASPAIGDASVSPGMAMGLDARELLPPFFPVLHAEDYVFGATLWQCDGHALLGHLPWSVLHDPAPGKSILLSGDLGPERRMVVPEFAHLMRRLILECDLPERAGAQARTNALGRHLTALASRPAADFREAIRTCILGLEGEKLAWLAGELREDEGSSEWWRGDVEAYLEHTRAAFADDDFDIPYDLKSARSAEENRVLMQRLVGGFGRLLEHWPAIFAAAREMNESGAEPLFDGTSLRPRGG
jgi:hypothetical protein